MNIKHITWRDVGIPPRVVKWIESLRGPMLDYLIVNRVFRFQIKAQYTYNCRRCEFVKKVYRAYEDYSVCQKCHSDNVYLAKIGWRMGKDEVQPYSSDESQKSVSRIASKVAELYQVYFGVEIPENFFSCGLVFNSKESDIIVKKWSPYDLLEEQACDLEKGSKSLPYRAQFCCGAKVESHSLSEAACKASVLCPFLWDDCFDWKLGSKKDAERETHIIPLFHMWSKYLPSLSCKQGPQNKRLKMPSGVSGYRDIVLKNYVPTTISPYQNENPPSHVPQDIIDSIVGIQINPFISNG